MSGIPSKIHFKSLRPKRTDAVQAKKQERILPRNKKGPDVCPGLF